MNEVDYNQLIQEGKRYLKLEFNYERLSAVEKMSVLLSGVALVAVIAVICGFVLIYLASTFVTIIAEATGKAWIGNLAVAGIFVVFLMLVLLFKRQLIVDPITRYLTKLFLKPTDNE